MLELAPLRGRPGLRAQVFPGAFGALWPAFTLEDRAAGVFFARPCLTPAATSHPRLSVWPDAAVCG